MSDPSQPWVESLESRTLFCTMPLLHKPAVDQAPSASLDSLTPELKAAVQDLRRRVQAHGGTLKVRSTYRPAHYQKHLRAVRDAFVKLTGYRGVTATVVGKRPQLAFDERRIRPKCRAEILVTGKEVNDEIRKHLLKAGPKKYDYAPLVAGNSKHSLTDENGNPASEAIDFSVKKISTALLNKLAKKAGLYRGENVSEKDDVHWELAPGQIAGTWKGSWSFLGVGETPWISQRIMTLQRNGDIVTGSDIDVDVSSSHQSFFGSIDEDGNVTIESSWGDGWRLEGKVVGDTFKGKLTDIRWSEWEEPFTSHAYGTFEFTRVKKK